MFFLNSRNIKSGDNVLSQSNRNFIDPPIFEKKKSRLTKSDNHNIEITPLPQCPDEEYSEAMSTRSHLEYVNFTYYNKIIAVFILNKIYEIKNCI